MPSSSDQLPDPWGSDLPEDSDASSAQGNELEDNDEFGIDELRDLLSERSDTVPPQSPESVLEELETLFPLDTSSASEAADPDFDALLSTLGMSESAPETLSGRSEIPISSPQSDAPLLSEPLEVTGPTDFDEPSEPLELDDVVIEPSEVLSEVIDNNQSPGLEERNIDSAQSNLGQTGDAVVSFGSEATELPSEDAQADMAAETDSSAEPIEETLADPITPSATDPLPRDAGEELPGPASEPFVIPVAPSSPATDEVQQEETSEQQTEQSGDQQEDAIAQSFASPATERAPLVGAATGTTPTAPVSSVEVTRPAGTGISTYKQILSGRRQISAFALILAGMGGIMGYGWSKAGIQNPFNTNFNEPGIGFLVDQDKSSEEDASLTPSSTSSLTTGAQGGTAESRNPEGDTLIVPITPPLSEEDEAEANQSSGLASVEDLERQPQDQSARVSGGQGDSKDVALQTPPPIDISDVPPEHWAHPYVVAMYEQGVVPDFPDGKFQPDKPVTRAELAASIQRAFKDQAGRDPIPFNDIPESFWAKDAITHAVNTGFMSGYSEDIFKPNQQIPRYQVLVSLVSGLGLNKIENPQSAAEILQNFPDLESMPQWAWGQVAASKQADLIISQPTDGAVLSPNRPATRAEVSAMIYQALVNAGKIEDTVN